MISNFTNPSLYCYALFSPLGNAAEIFTKRVAPSLFFYSLWVNADTPTVTGKFRNKLFPLALLLNSNQSVNTCIWGKPR